MRAYPDVVLDIVIDDGIDAISSPAGSTPASVSASGWRRT